MKRVFQQALLTLAILAFGASECVAAETLLIVRGQPEYFSVVMSGLTDDIGDEFDVNEVVVSNRSGVDVVEKVFRKGSPKLVVLLGNRAVELYLKFQKKNPDERFPPAIIAAALFVDKLAPLIRNATGIRYEIPVVTSAFNLRGFLGNPVTKVGVIYRAWMSDFIKENAALCLSEGIELISYELPNSKNKNIQSNIKKALAKIEREADALWILNDNALLVDVENPSLVKTWVLQRKKSKLPAIVGVRQFVNNIALGELAIVPDNYALGLQVAELLFEIKDNYWIVGGGVYQPISIKKYVNISKLKNKKIVYSENQLNRFDRVYE